MSKLKQRILLVEDEFFLAETIKARLEYLEYIVDTAENGHEAIESVKNNLPQLVLMDLIMPVMDGLEATKKLRVDYNKEALPIIALTAKAREEDKKTALAAGVNDYLCKPFEMDDFLQLIQKHIKKDS